MRGDRLLRLLLLLQTRGKMTVAELRRELEVSKRTVYRDLEALGLSGVPIVTERGPGGGCSLLEGYTTRLTGLTDEETRALFAALSPGALAPIGMDRALGAAMAKLAASLPARLRESEAAARGKIHFDLGEGEPRGNRGSKGAPEARVLAAMREAALGSRKLRILRVFPLGPVPGARLELRVDALGLAASSRGWTLVAGIGGTPKAVAAVDIAEAEVLDERFVPPKGFSLAAFWSEEAERRAATESAFAARLLLRPEAAVYLRPRFGLGLEAEVARSAAAGRAGAGGFVEIELRFSALEEAIFILPGLGDAVEVLEPLELRLALEDRALACARRNAPRGA